MLDVISIFQLTAVTDTASPFFSSCIAQSAMVAQIRMRVKSALAKPKAKAQAKAKAKVAAAPAPMMLGASAAVAAAPAPSGGASAAAGNEQQLATTGRRAASGSGADPKECSKIVMYLKYRSRALKADPALRMEAQEALSMYQGLSSAERNQFVAKWASTPKDQLQKNLKNFVAEFQQSVHSSETGKSDVQDGHFTRGQVLGFKGYTISDFDSREQAFG